MTSREQQNAFDIDDGAVFLYEDLKGPQGGDMTPLDAKNMVRDAVDDGSFKTTPEVKTNCVRVHYNDGSHVDIPVYRKMAEPDGSDRFEIASSNWKKSDPKGVNQWFDDRVGLRVGDAADQMRVLIRLMKAYCKHRLGDSLPSGFILTVLVDEKYWIHDVNLDRAYRNLITTIRDRLAVSKLVRHPVVDENLAEEGDSKCTKLQELLTTSLEHLAVLDRASCRRSEALKAWKKVFNTDYFDQAISDTEAKEKQAASAAVASVAVMPKPYASKW
ncbi:MAG: hypothetical protein ACI8T1_003697 [Verrucomicrobiales bacterium]|jgi:hypothetical protein